MLDEEMLTYYLDLMRSIGVQVIELEEHEGWLFRQTMDEGRRIQRMFLWKEGTEWRMDYRFPPVGRSCYFATQQLELMLKEIITGWYFLRNWNPTLPDARFYSKTEVDLSGWTIRELEGPWKTLVTPDGEELPIRHLSSSVDSMEGLCRVFPLSIEEILLSCDDYYGRPVLTEFLHPDEDVSLPPCDFPFPQPHGEPWRGYGQVIGDLLSWAEDLGLRVVRIEGTSCYAEVADDAVERAVCLREVRGWWRIGRRFPPTRMAMMPEITPSFHTMLTAGESGGHVAVRWFILRVGEILRDVLEFPPIMLPNKELAPGKQYEDMPLSWCRVLDEDGQPMDAVMRKYPTLSYVLDMELEELLASFQDPQGGSLSTWVKKGGYLE